MAASDSGPWTNNSESSEEDSQDVSSDYLIWHKALVPVFDFIQIHSGVMKPTETSEAAYIDNTLWAASEQTTGDGSNGPLAGLPRKTI